MIQCPTCHADNPDGTLLCNNCGRLITQTTTLSTQPFAVTGTPGENGHHSAHLGQLPERGVALYLGTATEPLIFTIKDRVVLGRRKDIASPDLIDLGPHDAYKMGVSRNHAVLTYKDARLYIQDTGSVNGTWQNNQRLKPYELYAIQPGASISLGQLIVYIYY